MPKVTIWIRNEDEAKWKAIENKPEWLHCALNPDLAFEGLKDIIADDGVAVSKMGKIFRTNFDGTYKEEVCQHYQPKGKCLVKGCK